MKYDPNIEITFVGTRHGIESRILPREGFSLKIITAGGLVGKKGLDRWVSWFKLPVGIAQSLCFLIRKRPGLVVGVGGYSSGPLALSAAVLKIPLLIHEQNAIPGLTNRWLGKIADKIAISFKQSISHFPNHKTVETGNMIREEFCKETEVSLPQQDPFVILVFGGSQGARSINQGVIDALEHLEDVRSRILFIHQTGGKDNDSINAIYEKKGFVAEVKPFFFNMADQYRRASLVICRAGATTLAELTASGKASILIPFPHATQNHQVKNAEVLKAENAAEMIYDHELTGEILAGHIRDQMGHPHKWQEMSLHSYRLGNRKATQEVAELCLKLIEEGKSLNRSI